MATYIALLFSFFLSLPLSSHKRHGSNNPSIQLMQIPTQTVKIHLKIIYTNLMDECVYARAREIFCLFCVFCNWVNVRT